MKSRSRCLRVLAVGVALALAGGCASAPAVSDEADDPIEPLNRRFHRFNNFLDDKLLRPVADGYVAVTSEWVRERVTSFFANAAYPNVILNDFLQGKIGQGVRDTFRLVANTTVGVGGLFDVAGDSGFPAHDEDLGQTLGVWGLGETAYLELPFFGPNSVRDAPDLPLAGYMNPIRLMSLTVTLPLAALDIVNSRANLSSAIALRDRSALDPYVFTREAYRQRRRFLIYDGDPPDEEFERFDPQSFNVAPPPAPG